ncbi:MAG: TetR/AcrR family transcriptional regulator [Idiomarina sp.]
MAYRETVKVKARKAATRNKLLTSATELVSEAGFRQVQMSAVARKSGVAVGTLYKYFASKEKLFTNVFQMATEREVSHVELALQGSQSAPQRLRNALQLFAERALKNPTLAWALIAEPVDPEVDLERLIYRARYAQLFERTIEQGITAGDLPSQNANCSSTALVGAIAESLIGPLAPKHPGDNSLDQATVINHILNFCLQGLGASKT